MGPAQQSQVANTALRVPSAVLREPALRAPLGGPLLDVFIDELSPERHSSFGWVVAGLVAYALLLIFATVAGKPGTA